MKILAIDPGTTESGVVVWADGAIMMVGVEANEVILAHNLKFHHVCGYTLAIEMMKARGMKMSNDAMETLVWVGRFKQAWPKPDEVRLVYREDVKMHVCGSPTAKDANVRTALLDLVGKPGTKKAPGPTYGVTKHAWAALAVAVTLEGLR